MMKKLNYWVLWIALFVFNFNTQAQCAGKTADFNFIDSCNYVYYFDASSGFVNPSYSWDFGNGNYSTQMNPTNIYNAIGTYTVTLIVSDSVPACSDTIVYSVNITSVCAPSCANRIADFAFGDSTNCNGIWFNSYISGFINPASYYWDFGDGGSSTYFSPTHQYSASGTYTVSLIVSDSICSDTMVQVVTATCDTNSCAGKVANFNFSDSCSYVFFNNTSSGFVNPTSYSWNFGDGQVSNQAYPTHIYNAPGSYNVSLVVSDSTCSDTISMNIVVSMCSNPCANRIADFTFGDSTNCNGIWFNRYISGFINPASYSWDFGDGNTSTYSDPTHAYNSSGAYTVTLIVSDSICSDTMVQVVTASCDTICDGKTAGFYYSDSCELFQFTSTLTGYTNPNYDWSFGDGNFSTLANPQNAYSNSGTYLVTLFVSDSICTDSISQIITVTGCDTNITCSELGAYTATSFGYFQNFVNSVWFIWTNNSNASVNANITITFPPTVTLDYSNYTYVVSGNTLTLNMTLAANTSYSDLIGFACPPGIPNGTLHNYSINITPTNYPECTINDNTSHTNFIVGTSYDPNCKQVNQSKVIGSNIQDEFIYKIIFQNTGTAPAQDVYLLDTLSNNLDWTTFQFIRSSHNVNVLDLGNGVKKFDFQGIWLPDSASNFEESIGYVLFKIKEKASNTAESEIMNTAYIYFDQNPAIVTNTTYSINKNLLGITSYEKVDFSIVPNPANNQVTVQSNHTIEQIKIYSIDGKLVFQANPNELSSKINLEKLDAQMYFVKIKTEQGLATKRLIVQ